MSLSARNINPSNFVEENFKSSEYKARKHDVAIASSSSVAYSFCGRSVYSFNLQKREFGAVLEATGGTYLPEDQEFHKCLYCAETNCVYLYGGLADKGEDSLTQIIEYNIKSNSFRALKTKFNPFRRAGHAFFLRSAPKNKNNNLVNKSNNNSGGSGGDEEEGTVTIDTLECRVQFCVYAGYNGTEFLTDMHVLDFGRVMALNKNDKEEEEEDENATIKSSSENYEPWYLVKQQVTSYQRSAFGCVYREFDDCLYAAGGCSPANTDFYRFSFQTLEWSLLVRMKEHVNSGRFHVALIGQDYAFVKNSAVVSVYKINHNGGKSSTRINMSNSEQVNIKMEEAKEEEGAVELQYYALCGSTEPYSSRNDRDESYKLNTRLSQCIANAEDYAVKSTVDGTQVIISGGDGSHEKYFSVITFQALSRDYTRKMFKLLSTFTTGAEKKCVFSDLIIQLAY